MSHSTAFGIAIALAGAVCTSVLAQAGGEAAWLWEVTTQNGDAILEPGESATITLSIDFAPDADFNGPVLGLAGAVFDTQGGGGAVAGSIVGWEVLNGLEDLTGDTTTTNGVSLFGTTAAQRGEVIVHDDPIDVLQFEWSTDDFRMYVVEYQTSTFLRDEVDHLIYVWEGTNNFDAEAFVWPIEEAAISFQVVPAPAAPLLLALAGIAAARRRRR